MHVFGILRNVRRCGKNLLLNSVNRNIKKVMYCHPMILTTRLCRCIPVVEQLHGTVSINIFSCFLSEAGIPSSLTWFVMSQSSVEMQNHSRYALHARVSMATAPALTTPRFCVGCHLVTIGARFMFLKVLSCACESRTLRAVTSCAWLLEVSRKGWFWFESPSTKSHHWRRYSVRKRCGGSD